MNWPNISFKTGYSLLVVVLYLAVFAEAVFSQAGRVSDSVMTAELTINGKKAKTPVDIQVNRAESLQLTKESHQALLEWFYSQGFLSARVDDLKHGEEKIKVIASKGCQYDVGQLLVNDNVADSIGIAPFQPLLAPGNAYTNKALEQEINAIINHYEQNGFPLVEVQISEFNPQPESCKVDITLFVDAGENMRVSGILFPNLEINDPNYVRTATGVKDSALITPELMEASKRNLNNTGLFEEVKEPNIVIDDRKYLLQYDLEERNPNSFDGLIGLVPEQNGSGNTLVGDIELKIRNVIWPGTTTDINFRRLEDLVTRLRIGYERDWIFDIPFGAGLDFNFLQQDTSYQVRNLTFKGSYNFGGTTKINGSLRRQSSVANDDPDLNVDVLDANAIFAGLGFEFDNTDNRISPTRGLELSLSLETGVKDVSDERAEADSIENRLSQRIFEVRAQPYLSLFNRTVLTTSLNAFVIQSDQLNESDLIRFGGARSLRGFREEQFMASRMFWGDVEYRYRLDPTSYAFVFGALSTFERARLATEPQDKDDVIQWVNSWGFGMTFTTPLGLLQFSYAVSSENTFQNGVVHFGIIADI